MPATDPVQAAFEKAQREFRKKLKDPGVYDEILRVTTVDHVYEATAKLQETILRKGRLRNLGKIGQFLKQLSSYATVIEVFIQVKPDLLALIWGPIKLLLLWSSQLDGALDKVTDLMEKVGKALPQFTELAEAFENSDTIRAALALFFEDILEIYRITMVFFCKTRWQQLFEIIWPKCQTEIDLVLENINKHADLFRNEVTTLDIKEAREARVLAMVNYANANNFQEREKYLGLKARVAPEIYDEKLDWVRNRSVANCARWLFRDRAFSEWLDPSNKAVTWFWLQGIPGAGKTYLSASTIDDIKKKQQRVLFAFVSHISNKAPTALSVIQSLIFQAAEDDKDFQSLLVEVKESELLGNTGHASDLLGNFLKAANGPTYIVVDGLDEMDECERQILLQQLEGVSKDSDDLRLLISSRAEDDISRALDRKTKGAKVHDKNYGSIQNYIDHRSQAWISRCEFDPSTKSEVLGLLSPLSVNAGGMFLFARIILDNLEQMTSTYEIRNELKALPIDLNDAYHRIFQRINDSRPAVRDKCRRVLGWLACAPNPLTILEMEQALSVDATSDKIPDEIPQMIARMNFVQMCGPIIEVVGEHLQFVHFTVPDGEIDNCLNKTQAAIDLAMSFLVYLSLSIREPEIDSEEIDGKILTGQYRLFQYAVFYWPILLLPIKDQGDQPELGKLLKQFTEIGTNHDVEESNADGSDRVYKNDHLQSKSPEVYEMLCATFKFHLDDKRWEWQWANSHAWANLDPLVTSQLLVRIQERYDILVLDLAFVESIRYHYGSHIFKCTYPFCAHSRRGFADQRDLSAHFKDHGRPWKCSLSTCEFCSIGFSSRRSRDDHWKKYHLPTASQLQYSSDDFESLDAEEVQPILFGIIIQDDVERAKLLLSSSNGKRLKKEVIAFARWWAVAEWKSLAMTKLLAPPHEEYLPSEIVVASLNTGSVEFVRWSLAKAKESDYSKFMKVALDTASDEIYTIWEEHIVENLANPSQEKMNLGFRIVLEDLFKPNILNSARNDILKESRLKSLLRKAKEHANPECLGFILGQIARSSCSLPIAQEVLELGAAIDYPWGFKGKKGMTAIQAAARRVTEEAAYFMRFLVFQGADTDSLRYKKDIGSEKGAAQIATWLGITWDELKDEYMQSLITDSSTYIDVRYRAFI